MQLLIRKMITTINPAEYEIKNKPNQTQSIQATLNTHLLIYTSNNQNLTKQTQCINRQYRAKAQHGKPA